VLASSGARWIKDKRREHRWFVGQVLSVWAGWWQPVVLGIVAIGSIPPPSFVIYLLDHLKRHNKGVCVKALLKGSFAFGKR